jgi:peptide/nickel transport system substrate-binding protein
MIQDPDGRWLKKKRSERFGGEAGFLESKKVRRFLMRKAIKLVGVILVCASLFLYMAGCANTPDDNVETPEKTFIIARSNDAGTLDTGYAFSEGEIDLMYHIYEGLVRFKNDDLDVEPWLAKDWSVSGDGTVWTFNLQEGIKFHDGTDFNADAVVFSYMRLLDENHPFYGLDDVANSYFDYLLSAVVEDVKAVDEYTVEISLNQVFGPFLTYMGLYSQYIVSPTAVETHGDEYFKNPVGTGPFKFVEWQSDEFIKLSRFEDYWGSKPDIDAIIWKVVPEDSTRLMELQAGSVHAIKNIQPAQLETIQKDAALELIRVPGSNLFYMAINHAAEPFDDLRVRQAVAHAIDLDSLVEAVYGGLGTRAVNSMPPTIFGYNTAIKPYSYDVAKAKELLADAGYPDGVDIDLHVFASARVMISRPVDAAEIMKSDLSKAGINANVIVNEWATHRPIVVGYEHQFATMGWYDIPYPSNFLQALVIDGARHNYDTTALKVLANKAMSTYDRAEQEKFYKEMQEIIHRDVVILNVAHSDYTAVVRKGIKGFELDPIGNVKMHNVKF